MSRTVEILDRLVAFETVSGQSNLALIDYASTLLSKAGARVVPVPSADGDRAGLFATLGPENGEGVLLSAHSDVVPVEGQPWTRPAFRLTQEGDRLFGRGTTDMKGFLAACLALAERVQPTDLAEPLKFAISYDEEIGCVGMGEMIGRLNPAIGPVRAAIVGEPTDMRVATGHKGKAAFRAVFTGEAGHSAMAPRFVNAIHLATDFVGILRDTQSWLENDGAHDSGYDIPYSTVHTGRISGGTALNIVPDRAEIAFEFRHLAEDDPADILKRISEGAEGIARRYRPAFAGASVDLIPVAAYPGLEAGPDGETVADMQALAGTAGTIKVPFGTEAGFLAGLGIPTVVCGPGNMAAQGHKADEFITRDQLARCDRMLDRLAASLTG